MTGRFQIENLALLVVRFMFLLVAGGIGVQVARNKVLADQPGWYAIVAFAGVMIFALAMIGFDILFRRKQLDVITAIYFGLIIGLFLTYVLRLALEPILSAGTLLDDWATIIVTLVGMVLCYACISVLLQTKDDFRFIIPYVEFSKEIKGIKPYVVDTSVIIDGRIADVAETELLDSQLILPRFVLNELQSIADSSDKMRRSRGRRGLDVMNRLRNNEQVDVTIFDRDLPELEGQPVDIKLVLLAKHLNGKVVTNDYNLNKVAKLHDVPVVNLNDLANALKPVFLPGEHVEVRIVKVGEEAGQGVAYLDDGTMIVVEGGRDHIGKDVAITVTSVLQTSAGRMIFGRFEGPAGEQSVS